MIKLFQRYKRALFIAALFLLPLIPFFALRLELPRLNLWDRVSAGVIHPGVRLIGFAVDGVSIIWTDYVNLIRTKKENDELKKNNADLKSKILSLEQEKIENERLRGLLFMPKLPDAQFIAARVIGEDSTRESLGFLINAGAKDGIKVRMPVVTAEGIVGTITRVFGRSSLFLSIHDSSHTVSAQILRSRAHFIVEGRGRTLLSRSKFLDRAEDIRLGDEVITSGMDGVFPKGLLVGTIVSVSKPNAGVVQDAELRSSADVGKLDEVLVITGDPTKFDIDVASESQVEGQALPATKL